MVFFFIVFHIIPPYFGLFIVNIYTYKHINIINGENKMSKPIGAMSAGDYASLTSGRGTPPRYTHLPQSEAWAKIDAEQEAMQKQADDIRIESEVQKRMAGLSESVSPVKSFEGKEMSQVLQVLSALGDVEQASSDGIVLMVNDVKVLVSKA